MPQRQGIAPASCAAIFIIGLFYLLRQYLLLSSTATMADDPGADEPEASGSSARYYRPVDLIADLPAAQLPSPGSPSRVIVVGDVHGMLDPLERLLAKVSFDGGTNDRLVLAGDLVSKGPHSHGVIHLAKKVGALAVRGNHEDRILRAVAGRGRKHGLDEGAPPDLLKTKHHKGGLTGKDLRWLADLPLIQRIGHVDGMGEVVVVHAGLIPGVKLEKQDPWVVMNIRSLLKAHETEDGEDVFEEDEVGEFDEGAEEGLEEGKRTELMLRSNVMVPDDGHDGKRWSDVWNDYQRKIKHPRRMSVVYGHDAKRGLCVDRYTYGIDSACVTGGKLTALVLEGDGAVVKHKIVQVSCEEPK